MATEKEEQSKPENNGAAVKPDTETLQTTDPQEHMQGPISSLMQKLENTFDTKETREEANKNKNI